MHGQSKVRDTPRIAVITPEDATALLEHNSLNRPLRDQHVRRIAKQILEGKWKFNGDTIKISKEGDVLDGQHRLWAIIESKKPIETIVVYGIERDAFATIDTMRAVRTGGDVLALNGAARYRNIMASALTWLIRWQNKCITDHRDPKHKVENSDIERAYTENPGIVRAVERCGSLRGLANPSLVSFFYYLLANRNPDLAERMVTTLENPAGIGINDPFFRLRTYFTGDQNRRRDAVLTIAVMIKAANAAFAEKEVKALNWRSQGNTPEEFPKLDIGGQSARFR